MPDLCITGGFFFIKKEAKLQGGLRTGVHPATYEETRHADDDQANSGDKGYNKLKHFLLAY